MKVYRKTATVKAKIFELGDEDGFVHRDGTAGAGKAAREGVTQPDLVPYITTLENKYFTGKFGENYICVGAEGERWLVKKSIFESTYEEDKPTTSGASFFDLNAGVAGLHVCGQYTWDPRSTAQICLICGSEKHHHKGISLTPTPNVHEEKTTPVHVNQIKVEGETPWARQFNLCSDLYLKSLDRSLSAEERKKYLDLWFEERQRLELGIY